MNNPIDKAITQALTQFAKEVESEAVALLSAEGLGHIIPKAEIKKGLLGASCHPESLEGVRLSS